MNNLTQREIDAVLSNRVSLDYQLPITIRNRDIIAPLIINESTTTRNQNTRLRELQFISCTFKEPVNFGKGFLTGTVIFDNCLFEKNVRFDSITYLKISDDCIFEDDLTLSTTSEGLSIDNFTVFKTLYINGESGRKVSISNLNINTPVESQKLIINPRDAEITVKNIYVDKFELFENSSVRHVSLEAINANNLDICTLELNSTLTIKDSQIKKLKIENVHGEKRNYSFIKNSFDDITFELNSLDYCDITGGSILSLELTGKLEMDDIFNLENVDVKNLAFTKVFNKGLCVLRHIFLNEQSRFSLLSSNLGKTNFINCDFSSAIFEFDNSQMTEVFIAETNFPQSVIKIGKPNPFQGQLAFGQLASVFQRQGDNIRSLEYQSREIEQHYDSIEWPQHSFPFFNLTKLNLFLNKWSNNFGRDWGRGIVFTLSVGIIFFYGVVIGSNEYNIGFALDFNLKFISSFLKFMNPLRIFETENLFKLNKDENYLNLTSLSYLWDFLGRIFVTYGYYQIIQAFRRFGRR